MADIILDSNINRIQGDFSNIAVNTRTSLQTSTLNSSTGVYAIPNGSSTSAGYVASNNSDPTNSSTISLIAGASEVQLNSSVNGSGTYLPLSIYNSGDIRFQVNTSGALGVRTGVGTVGFGTSGQVLTSAGSSASPTWSNPTLIPSFYYALNSASAGANATGAQAIFGVGATLAASTQYEIELSFTLYKTAGTTSHTIALGFGGTATYNSFAYQLLNQTTANLFVITGGSGLYNAYVSTNAATVVTGGLTNATSATQLIVKGIISVNASGTFIPQYTLSAAPGGAYSTQIGGYVKLTPLGASGANINIGSWA